MSQCFICLLRLDSLEMRLDKAPHGTNNSHLLGSGCHCIKLARFNIWWYLWKMFIAAALIALDNGVICVCYVRQTKHIRPIFFHPIMILIASYGNYISPDILDNEKDCFNPFSINRKLYGIRLSVCCNKSSSTFISLIYWHKMDVHNSSKTQHKANRGHIINYVLLNWWHLATVGNRFKAMSHSCVYTLLHVVAVYIRKYTHEFVLLESIALENMVWYIQCLTKYCERFVISNISVKRQSRAKPSITYLSLISNSRFSFQRYLILECE